MTRILNNGEKETVEKSVRLRPARAASATRRHPWVFSGSVFPIRTGQPLDRPVPLVDANGHVMGHGFLSPASPIVLRLWRFGPEALDAAYVAALILNAAKFREECVPKETSGYRLINAEGDHLPGLIVDRYASTLVVQAATEGTERAKPLWLPPLKDIFPGFGILQKNSLPSRLGEGLPVEDEVLSGHVPGRIVFTECGLSFIADAASGQKTGFFLDQRENRQAVRRLAHGKRVLNLFSYSGAFGVAALAGGAACVTQVDISRGALDLARENHTLNGQITESGEPAATLVAKDVFTDLRERVESREQWDLVVTDPPAFAKKRDDVDRAARGYKDVNRLAMKLLKPGGTLLACSCSGPISPDLFQKILFGAALDAGVRLQILEERGAGPDHPVSVDCPEGRYLKAFLLRRT